jgi:hypothetical protein
MQATDSKGQRGVRAKERLADGEKEGDRAQTAAHVHANSSDFACCFILKEREGACESANRRQRRRIDK